MSKDKDKEKEIRNQFTVVLEGLRDDFKMFGENLEGVREKGEATFEKVGQLSEDVGELKQDMAVVKKDVGTLKEDMNFVKGELRLIRNELKEKVGRDEFIALEERVIALENIRNT